jgi:prepilin-type processing-associated H-X9-DG protein
VAVHNFALKTRHLPSSIEPGMPGAPQVAGFTELLPFLGEEVAHDSYNKTLNWDHVDNRPVVSRRIELFLCPSAPSANRLDGSPDWPPWMPTVAAPTDYSPINGVAERLHTAGLVDQWGEGMLTKNSTASNAHVTDGLQYTILYAESAGRPLLYRRGTLVHADATLARVNGGGWARPASEFVLDGSSKDGLMFPGPCPMNCTNGEDAATTAYPHPVYGKDGSGEPFSFHPGSSHYCFGDGSVRVLSDDIQIRELAKLVTRSKSELVNLDGTTRLP